MIEQLLFNLYFFGAGTVFGLALSNIADGNKNDPIRVIVVTVFWPLLIVYYVLKVIMDD